MRGLKWTEQAGVLLILSGILVGVGFPLAKIATERAIPVDMWIMLNSLGASCSLGLILLVKGQLKWPKGREFRYMLIAGPLTFAGPSILVFLIVQKVGAGFTGIMFALSPVFTSLLARILGLGSLGNRRVIGLTMGLIGAIGISLSRDMSPTTESIAWFIVPLSIPLVLAAGNLYRTMNWPKGAAPEFLAFWSHVAAFTVFLVLSYGKGTESLFTYFNHESWLVSAKLFISALAGPVVFRLQKYGGPVLLSQIGYVAAGVSLLVSTALLGETFPILSWLSTLIIAIGLTFTLTASRKAGWGQPT